MCAHAVSANEIHAVTWGEGGKLRALQKGSAMPPAMIAVLVPGGRSSRDARVSMYAPRGIASYAVNISDVRSIHSS